MRAPSTYPWTAGGKSRWSTCCRASTRPLPTRPSSRYTHTHTHTHTHTRTHTRTRTRTHTHTHTHAHTHLLLLLSLSSAASPHSGHMTPPAAHTNVTQQHAWAHTLLLSLPPPPLPPPPALGGIARACAALRRYSVQVLMIGYRWVVVVDGCCGQVRETVGRGRVIVCARVHVCEGELCSGWSGRV